MPRDKKDVTEVDEENQRLRQLLADLDELPREGGLGTVSGLKGCGDMTTSVSKGIRSMPGGQDRYYLDLYLMQKERDRLAKETTWIKRRRLRVGRRLADISRDVAEKEQMAIQDMTILTGEPAPEQGERLPSSSRGKKSGQKKYEYKEGEWQRISINY